MMRVLVPGPRELNQDATFDHRTSPTPPRFRRTMGETATAILLTVALLAAWLTTVYGAVRVVTTVVGR
jgi:hypothetical protein